MTTQVRALLVLLVGLAAGVWANASYQPPASAVLATNSTTQTVNTGSTTTLTFDSERYDSDGLHSTSSNTSRLTFPTAGKYTVKVYVNVAANASGYRYTDVRLNGSTVIAIDTRTAVTTDTGGGSLVFDYDFSAGDYIETRLFQNSGSNLATTARFAATRIRE